MVHILGKPRLLKKVKHVGQVPLPVLTNIADLQRAFRSVVLRLRVGIFLVDTIGQFVVEALEPLEPRLHLVPPERVLVHEPCPFFVVIPRADREDAKVDGAGAAEAFSSRVVDFPSKALRLRCRLVAPVHGGVLLERGPALAVYAEGRV